MKPQKELSSMDIIKCRKCGCEMGATSERCPVCGTPVSGNSQETPVVVDDSIESGSEEIATEANSTVISNDLMRSDEETSNESIDSEYNSYLKMFSMLGGIVFLIVLFCSINKSCSVNDNSSNAKQGVHENDSVLSVENSKLNEEKKIILERAKEIFDYIPDHGSSKDLEPEIFSKEFFDLVKRAFCAAEEWNEGVFGEEMYYWYYGQDSCEDDGLVGMSLISNDEKTAKIKVWFKNYTVNEHNMTLIIENDKWVLDNWDNKREEAKDIIEEYLHNISTNEKQVRQYADLLSDYGIKEGYTCKYFLYDITSNNVPELWMIAGTCEADTKIMVYTIKKDQAILIFDQSASNTSFYTGNNYVVMAYTHMGHERWKKLTYSRYMAVETIYENDIDVSEDYEYKEVPERKAELHPYNDEVTIREALKNILFN